jgi:hypothetical protein
VADVSVVTPGGTSPMNRPADQFSYVPGVTSINPASGPATGGTTVTITGTGFTGATAVDFGAVAASRFTVNSATQITATSPAGAGVVDVTVVTPGGTSSENRPADQFSYVPGVTTINPTSGPATGGTTVTITGMGFMGATAVDFGTVVASRFTVNSATQITATSPAGVDVVDVTVVTPSGTSPVNRPADQFSYVPSVTIINPALGPATGGTTVTISGTGFTGATTVDFGAVAASRFTVISATQITATSPAGSSVADVSVATPGGTSPMNRPADQFSYVPGVTTINPTLGPATGGTTVTIIGTGFTGATAVDFGAVAAGSFTVNSATQITATSPAGTGVVDVTVVTPGGTSSENRPADQFSYVPGVTTINPTSGPATGGTTVTITGAGFTSATAVDFGAVAASRFTVISATQITTTSPAGVDVVDVTVVTPSGTSPVNRPADQFSYVPSVTKITPTLGPATGGTTVTIAGTGFTGATAVDFAAEAATSFTVISATQITATSSAGAGVVDVTVVTPGGTSPENRPADQFSYVPSVTSISPALGPATGGATVTITGTGFTGATAVDFGTVAAGSFTVNSATQITATSPAGVGVVDVTVVTPSGTSPENRPADQFSYVSSVTSISPALGPATGGTTVTITGAGFTGATAVDFGAVAASRFTVISATQITATSPAGAGVVDVTVVTPSGSSSENRPADQFSYVPSVTSINPASGPATGGTTVTITGAGFMGATAVDFGAVAAGSFTVNSATQITATSPAGVGVVDVTVVTPGGTSSENRPADQFSYVPGVTTINPTSGPATGGTTVTITGTGFTGATAVDFGTVAASGFTVNSATQITATSPAGVGVVDVTVVTPSGSSSENRPADQFTYQVVPPPSLSGTTTTVTASANPVLLHSTVTLTATVSAVDPSSGTPAGFVAFQVGGKTLKTVSLDAFGKATWNVSTLGLGSNTIRAVYEGNKTFKTSTSGILKVQVNRPVATTTTLAASANPAGFGQAVSFTATVTSLSGPLTGSVTFTVNGKPLPQGSVPLGANGKAVVTISNLSVGRDAIEASYSGDSVHGPSTSAKLFETVKQPATALLVNSANPSTAGQAVISTGVSGAFPAGTPSLGEASANSRTIDAAIRALLLDESTVTGKLRPLLEL